MMHISEFARQSGIHAQTLRRYHAQGLLVPEVDPHSGYRWYSSSQLHTARVIQSLRGAGCNVALIRAMLHPSGGWFKEAATKRKVKAFPSYTGKRPITRSYSRWASPSASRE